MKVWRAIGITFIALLLMVFLAFSAGYFVLDNSVMDSKRVETALAASPLYEQIREAHVLPAIRQSATNDIEFGAALTQTDVIDSLQIVVTEDRVRDASNTVLDATYPWLNKKSPDIGFAIPLTEAKQQFLDELSSRVSSNLAKLPVCRTHSVPATLSEVTCISPYATRDSYRDEIMSTVSESVNQAESTISATTVKLDSTALGPARNIPDYISYLWTLNLITLPLAGLLALYLVIKRRGLGLLTVGLVLGVLTVTQITLGTALANITLPQDETVRLVATAIIPLIGDQIRLLAFWGGITSAIMIIVGTIWMRISRKRHAPTALTNSLKLPAK